MIGAIGRYIKAFLYLLTGNIDNARRTLDSNPNVMNAKYDEMARRMSTQITQFVNAASLVSAHTAKKKSELATLVAEITKLQQLQSGSLAAGKSVAARLQAAGKDPTSDVEYVTHRSAYNDFSSTLLEKLKRKSELEEAIKQGEETNNGHLSSLKNLKREYEDLKREQGEMVARMITSKQERELNESISGLDADTGKIKSERAAMRNMVMESEAAAKITGQIAGTDTRRAEEEYLEMAVRSAANSEFDTAVGLTPKTPTQLPASNNENIIDVQVVQTDGVTVKR